MFTLNCSNIDIKFYAYRVEHGEQYLLIRQVHII
jgi:hypothetical protein